MMKTFKLAALCTLMGTMWGALGQAQPSTQAENEAREVIRRFTNGQCEPVLSLSLKKENNCDRYAVSVKQNRLYIEGSNGVALCKGFYDYIKRKGLGLMTWSGKRFVPPTLDQNEKPMTCVSPFPFHYYLNPTTYGYSMAFWDSNRWDKEIDWMALHGVDMPLMMVAYEAVIAKVWKEMGLTDQEITAYFSGPNYLPWMRMGQLSGLEGPLPDSWHKDQITLAHHILARMYHLGMTPICPGFSGYVPQAITRIYPGTRIRETKGVGTYRNWMISPTDSLFAVMEKAYVKAWETEFGPAAYYWVAYAPGREDTTENTEQISWGKAVYNAVSTVNPHAALAIQRQANDSTENWSTEAIRMLTDNLPANKILWLDLYGNDPKLPTAKDYANSPWIYGLATNKGGQNGLRGNLSFYAEAASEAYNYAKKRRPIAFGAAPEGIENNEMVYELIYDGSWTKEPIDLPSWMHRYAQCRYGCVPTTIDTCYAYLRRSVYTPSHKDGRFLWQLSLQHQTRDSIQPEPELDKAYASFLAASDTLYNEPLYRTDLIEMTAFYAGKKAEKMTRRFHQGISSSSTQQELTDLATKILRLLEQTDALLEQHPTMSLSSWLQETKGTASTPFIDYEGGARRIITLWGPPNNEYSARLWSGLIRDYYMPRLINIFKDRLIAEEYDNEAFAQNWVNNTRGLAPSYYSLPQRIWKNPTEKFMYRIREIVKLTK